MKKEMYSHNKQRGATLIVALILLALMTVVGLSAMDSSTVDVKIVANAKDRQLAFNGAESTLYTVIRDITSKTCPLDATTTTEYVAATYAADPDYWNDTSNWTLTAVAGTSFSSDHIIEDPIKQQVSGTKGACNTGPCSFMYFYPTTVKSSGPGSANVIVRSHVAQKLVDGACSA